MFKRTAVVPLSTVKGYEMGVECREWTEITAMIPHCSQQPFCLSFYFLRIVMLHQYECTDHISVYVCVLLLHIFTFICWVKLWDWEIYHCGHWMFHILQPFLAKLSERHTLFALPPSSPSCPWTVSSSIIPLIKLLFSKCFFTVYVCP